MVGKHRIKLVEGTSSSTLRQFQMPLAAIEFMHDDVEGARQKLEKAGYPVLHERSLRSGGKAYYFGSAFHGVPLSIYPVAADDEILGS